jgi:hypothetical protein
MGHLYSALGGRWIAVGSDPLGVNRVGQGIVLRDFHGMPSVLVAYQAFLRRSVPSYS